MKESLFVVVYMLISYLSSQGFEYSLFLYGKVGSKFIEDGWFTVQKY